MPPAPRPGTLPSAGRGLANVDPLCWSISLEHCVVFVRTCVATDTWKALVAEKGEYNLTMYDVNAHFVKPWTRGTGCSIALLLAGWGEPMPAELMLSHAWGGSVVETYNCWQNLVNHHSVPKETRAFFCTLCMYQPEDHADGGLTISEQLDRKPFAKIIESRPKYGMYVLHTTLFEVYSRLWTVHEVDEGTEAAVPINGLFDIYRWTEDKFLATIDVHTREGQCRAEDKPMLTGLIEDRGGFERLDQKVAGFRQEMFGHLAAALKLKNPPVNADPPDKLSFTSGGGSELICSACAGVCTCCIYCCFCIGERFVRGSLLKSRAELSSVPNQGRSCVEDNMNKIRPIMGPFYETVPPNFTRTQRVFDWEKVDVVTQAALITGNNNSPVFFHYPWIDRNKEWKFERNWIGPKLGGGGSGLESMLPLGKDSYPFGDAESGKTNLDWFWQICCCATFAPCHLLAILVPPLCCLTPIVRSCPPLVCYKVLLAGDGDCTGVLREGQNPQVEPAAASGGGEGAGVVVGRLERSLSYRMKSAMREAPGPHLDVGPAGRKKHCACLPI